MTGNTLKNFRGQRLLPSLLFVLLFFSAEIVGAPSRPNVVLIMADDQGWGDVAYNGHPYLKTPTLDEMSRYNLRLDRFYAASSLCSPTRASVMTGRHANRSGVYSANFTTRPEEITIAQVLQKAGCHTGHFGKWHLGAVKKESPLNPGRMGFDEYLSHDNYFEINPMFSRNGGAPESFIGEGSEIIVDEAVKYLRRIRAADPDQPFFVVLWFGSPHNPHFGMPADLASYSAVTDETMRARYAEITAMDRAVGTFRTALRELNVADNTLLWYNSDNGIGVGTTDDNYRYNGGWRGRKAQIHEGGLLVPAIIEWPAVIKTPRTSSVRCVTSDIFPTLLDLLDLTSPDPSRPLDGISLRPLIVDQTMEERPSPIGFWTYSVVGEMKNTPWIDPKLSLGTLPTDKVDATQMRNFHHPVAKTKDFGGQAAWTANRYKLIVGTSDKPELYDLLKDPKEAHDVAAVHPDIVVQMNAQLEAWQLSVEHSLTGADYKATR